MESFTANFIGKYHFSFKVPMNYHKNQVSQALFIGTYNDTAEVPLKLYFICKVLELILVFSIKFHYNLRDVNFFHYTKGGGVR